ncbi:MAG: hypothetical protein KGI54_18445 [Pseudomonadota bacterium]|nr:hypothetical protein [Pseudomonadota bacterium]
MNLHGIASAAISAVNPMVPVSIQVSTGYTTNPDGTQVPIYSTVSGSGQMQPLTGKEIAHLDRMNIQGVEQSIYLTGNYEGIFRVLGKGGDLLLINGRTYLVETVFERWPDWCKLGIVMQLDT